MAWWVYSMWNVVFMPVIKLLSIFLLSKWHGLDFHHSLLSALHSSPRRMVGHVSGKPCLWCKFIIKFMQCFWLLEMSSDYNLDRSTWHLQLKTFVISLFLKIVFPTFLYHIVAVKEHCMHGYCVLWKNLFFEHSSAIRLWFSKLVMHIKTCQRWQVGLHDFHC